MTEIDTPDSKTCAICLALFTRPQGMKPYRWNETMTCGRSCGSRLAAITRKAAEGGGPVTPHRCALPGCDAEVPRMDGEVDSRYLTRKYCSEEHRREALSVNNGARDRTPAAWRVERTCACPCGRAFVPGHKRQRYRTPECAVAARKPRDEVEYARRKSARKPRPKPEPAPAPEPEVAPAPPPPPATKLVQRERQVWRPASWGGEYTVVEQVEVPA